MPYSRLVLYRYANVAQILKCTREYLPYNENWELALDFVNSACNDMLDSGADAFVTKYMKNECVRLVRRLTEYMTTDTFMIYDNLESCDRYLWEKKQAQKRTIKLNGYPLTIFSGSKVAGALDFVDSIKSLDELFPTEGYIATIRRCAEIVLPQLERDLKLLAAYITQQEKLLDERRADRDKSQAHLDEVKPIHMQYQERYSKIREELHEASEDRMRSVYDFTDAAIKAVKAEFDDWDSVCEEYDKRKKAYDEICDGCKKLASDISLHQRYKNQMEEHHDKIRRHLQD